MKNVEKYPSSKAIGFQESVYLFPPPKRLNTGLKNITEYSSKKHVGSKIYKETHLKYLQRFRDL